MQQRPPPAQPAPTAPQPNQPEVAAAPARLRAPPPERRPKRAERAAPKAEAAATADTGKTESRVTNGTASNAARIDLSKPENQADDKKEAEGSGLWSSFNPFSSSD